MIGSLAASKNLRAGRLVRSARLSLCLVFLTAAGGAMAAPPVTPGIAGNPAFLAASSGQSIADFYAARGGQPLWLREDGSAGEAAAMLVDYLRTAEADGLDPGRYPVAQLNRALQSAWGGSPARIRTADVMLSEAFAAYVRDLKRAPYPADIVWVDPQLRPQVPSPRQLLDRAADAPSLEAWMRGMGWMNPIYAGLRKASADGRASADRQVLRLNLERARALPAGDSRYIVVNATAQQLTAYEGGEAVDSMKVVVGKPKNPTPMMAALIRYASLNPYWFVPTDLAAERVAPNVVKHGLSYLKTHGYQVMSDWTDDASVLDPAGIDWQAVADGTAEVRLRQLPGPGNAMGNMKFMFPNIQGVYLHDTPQKELLTEASRMFSGGCVRLEDAPRLAQWMFGKPLEASSDKAELRVNLPAPIPVYITYLTIMPNGGELAIFPDVYGRDRAELAQLGQARLAGR